MLKKYIERMIFFKGLFSQTIVMKSHLLKNWLLFAYLLSSGTSCALHEFPAVP